MDRGLYIAASGMLAEQVRQDQIANDLANSSTAGYKADRASQRSFGDVLLLSRESGEVIGSANMGSHIAAIKTDFSQGALKQTDEPLDVALDGPGFLAVRTPQGVRYTRDGQLTMGAGGKLTTLSGYAVLDSAGRDVTVPAGDMKIARDGSLTVASKTIGRLGVVSLTNPKKAGDNLFTGTAGAAPAGTSVRQGFLEASGVDPARAMVDMIASLRAYESAQRVIHAIDETLGKGIQSGSTQGG
jgi:flagellar basal-body rod protein FlgF